MGVPRGRRLEQPARGTVAHARHSGAGHVQRQPAGAVEGGVLGRREVADEEEVRGPGEVVRVAGAAHQEAGLRPQPCRLDEQLLERGLPVGGEGAEVGEVGAETLQRLGRPVDGRVDAAVKRRHMPGAEDAPQLVQRQAARVAQHEVEVAQAARADIGDLLAGLERRQRHRRVEVVEGAHPYAGAEHEVGRRDAVRAVGGDDGGIRVAQIPRRRWCHLVPVGVEDEPPTRQLGQVAVHRVVVDVPLVEDNRVAPPGERPAQPSPQGRVTVAPGRADREPEDDKLHAPPSPSSGRPNPTGKPLIVQTTGAANVCSNSGGPRASCGSALPHDGFTALPTRLYRAAHA